MCIVIVSPAESTAPPALDTDIANYIASISRMHDIQNECGLSFWPDCANQTKFATLYELAQDFVSAPASQVYSECVIFTLW